MPDQNPPPADAGDPVSAATPAQLAAVLDFVEADADPADLAPPNVPGYELIERLGEGGHGVVWRAEMLATGRQVAVKLLRDGPLARPHDRARLRREVRALAAVRHPNLVSVLASDTTPDGWLYLVMDYVQGLPLDQYFKFDGNVPSCPQEIGRRLRLLSKVAQAVAAIHSAGLVHRDLKPTNILVTADGEPHVLDFGLARAGSRTGSDPASPGGRAAVDVHLATVTAAGQFVGSLPWASPEQAAGVSGVDARSDVYALGVLLYQSVTGGRFPQIVGTTIPEALRNIASSAAPTPPSRVRTGPITPTATWWARAGGKVTEIVRPRWLQRQSLLDRLVLRALAKRPEDRYADAGMLANAIDAFLGGHELPDIQRLKPARWRRAGLIGLIAAGTLAVVTVVGVQRIWHKKHRTVASAAGVPTVVARQVKDQPNSPPIQTRPGFIAGWGTVIDPDKDCTVKGDAQKLTITVPNTLHNLNPSIKSNAPRVLQEVEGDFIATVKVTGDFVPGNRPTKPTGSPFVGAGLLLWQDDKNCIRLERNNWWIAENIYAHYTPLLEYYKDGQDQHTNLPGTDREFFKGRSTFFRLERRGAMVAAFYSHDGTVWVKAKEIAVDLPAKVHIGVAAVNSSNAPLTVEFEQFSVAALK